MDGFARRKEQSKEDIRMAAWELFSQFGVDKVSMTDVARKAGVSQATIYNNFDNKEALAREFVTTMVESLVSNVQEIVVSEHTYREKMTAFFQFISAQAKGSVLAAVLHHKSLQELVAAHPSLRDLEGAARVGGLVLGRHILGGSAQLPADLSPAFLGPR